MITSECKGCRRITGDKRALGWGTFFATIVTFGLWLLVLPPGLRHSRTEARMMRCHSTASGEGGGVVMAVI